VKNVNKYLVLALLLLGVSSLKAQQLPIYSQYLLNGFMVNPAMAGYDGYTTINATSRQQWMGFKEAPQTYSASWQTRLFRKEKVQEESQPLISVSITW